MKSKELSLPVKLSENKKIKNKSEQTYQRDIRNQAGRTGSKSLKDDRKQSWYTPVETNTLQPWLDQGRPLGGGCISVRVKNNPEVHHRM